MDTIVQYLQANIVLVLFIGLGYLVGKLKIGSLARGPTTGILFVALFGVLGTITVTVAGVTLAVLGGAAMGAMVGGVVLGWLRSRSPLWGSVAAPAGDALVSLGLGVFIAAVAIGAGGDLQPYLHNCGAGADGDCLRK